ncbi:hypothetical protein PARA125_000699 [Parachlamydia sp. AcF125]|nr:hypothetical protein [Parachlamydia sp. AcF125]
MGQGQLAFLHASERLEGDMEVALTPVRRKRGESALVG